jgi:DNA-binding transcriptional LysR family regulator
MSTGGRSGARLASASCTGFFRNASTSPPSVAVSPSKAGKATCSHAVPFVLPRGGLARDAARRWFHRQRLDPAIAAEVDGHEALLTLVSLGIGAGVVPRLVLDTSVAKGRLAVIPTDPPIGTFVVGLCARRTDLRRPVLSALWASVAATRRSPDHGA